VQDLLSHLYAEWRFIARSQFFSIYWILSLVACVFIFPILWKEKLRYLKIVGTFLVFFFTYRMLVITVPYTTWEINIDFLLTKHKILLGGKEWLRNLYLSVFYIHIFSAPFVLIAGVTQFSRTLMYEKAQWHRNIGKMYVATILFLSAPAGLVMSFYANGNLVSKFSFAFLSVLWWVVTFWSYRLIRNKKILEHGNWMLRSYALTFSAITLRLYMFVISKFHLFSTWTDADIYVMLSFMSWIPNLVVAEILIARSFSKKLIQKKPTTAS
jgi:hypothetical protein